MAIYRKICSNLTISSWMNISSVFEVRCDAESDVRLGVSPESQFRNRRRLQKKLFLET